MTNFIPKIIHQIWIQGETYIPEKYNDNIKKIKELHTKPEWTYMFWDERKILDLINQYKQYNELYYKFSYMHQKIDLAKLLILYTYGGIAIDIDAHTIKNLDNLFEKYKNYDLIVSEISQHLSPLSMYNICNKFSGCLNNGIIIAKPNIDIIKYMMDRFTAECSVFQSKEFCISNTTGPKIFNKLINEYMNNNTSNAKSKIMILNYRILEPCIFDICDINDDTIILHKHASSWIHPLFVSYMRYYILYEMQIWIFIIIIISIIIILLVKCVNNK